MREIKFRAWDETRGKFWCFSLDDSIAAIRRVLTLSEWNALEKEQYTGLKDKHGTPIYEGDILKWEDTKDVVEWDEAGACFGSSQFIPPLDRIYYWKEAKVIGNIYENPELLK